MTGRKQDRCDTRQVSYRKVGIQGRWHAGPEGYMKGPMQERRDEEKEG